MTEAERYERYLNIERNLPFRAAARLREIGFFTAPASTKYHGAYEGGLFDHSYNVAETLDRLTKQNSLVWSRPESPWIIGMFHDLCKVDQYIPNLADGNDSKPYIYNTDVLYKGHGDKSVMFLSTFTQLTDEEVACVRYHMGAFTEKEEWELYTRAIHRYPNVLWTHMADMIAAHVIEVD